MDEKKTCTLRFCSRKKNASNRVCVREESESAGALISNPHALSLHSLFDVLLLPLTKARKQCTTCKEGRRNDGREEKNSRLASLRETPSEKRKRRSENHFLACHERLLSMPNTFNKRKRDRRQSFPFPSEVCMEKKRMAHLPCQCMYSNAVTAVHSAVQKRTTFNDKSFRLRGCHFQTPEQDR